MEEKLPPTNGNGNGAHHPPHEQLPSAVVAPSGAPVSSAPIAAAAGAPEIPLIVVDDLRDEHGRIKPGRTLNPKGRQPGIPNKNTEFQRLLKSKELREVWNIAKKQAKEGKTSLLEFLLERALVKLTPEAAGIVINNSPQASAGASAHHETNVNIVAKLLADASGREDVARFSERLAACGAFSRDAGNVRN